MGPTLRNTKNPSDTSSSSAASRSATSATRPGFGARPDPEHDGAARAHERQAPLRRNRRRRERLRKGTAGPVDRLLLGSTPDDAGIRRRKRAQKGALAFLRLQEDELLLGQRVRERNAGRAAARADVHDRAVLSAYELETAQGVLQQNAPGSLDVVGRRQPRRGDYGFEPALKWG